MSRRDLIALVVSYAYVFGVVGFGVLLARGRRGPGEFTRKVVHVGVGSWVIPTIGLFDHGWAAAIAPGTFVFVNAFSRIFRPVAAVEKGAAKENLGTIYFPLSFAILLLVLWAPETRWAIAAGILPMAWGDALASEVGRGGGRHRYRVGGQTRSLEGSAAMFAGSFAGIAVAAVVGSYLPGGFVAPGIGPAVVALAALATVVEAVSVRGLDNLTVPLLTGAAAAWLAS